VYTKNTKRGFEKILILEGLPLLFSAVILAHEMGHVLIAKEDYKLSKKEEEGLCELMAYIWLKSIEQMKEAKNAAYGFPLLKSIRPEDILYHQKRIEDHKSEIYGKGFREALEAVMKGWSFRKLIAYVTEHQRYPTCHFDDFRKSLAVKPRVTPRQSTSSANPVVDSFTENVNKVVNLYTRTKQVCSDAVWGGREHKRVYLWCGEEAKRVLFFNAKAISFAQLQRAIEERVKDITMTHSRSITGIFCAGEPLRCDEDVDLLGNNDELYIELD